MAQRAAQARNTAGIGIAVGLGILRRLDHLIDDMLRRRQIGIAHAEVNNIAALGAKLANPDKKVVCVAGDGGFMFSAQEMAVAAQQGIAVVCIVFDNAGYMNVKMIQDRRFGGRNIATDLQNPDFVAFAESFGVTAERATTPEELEEQTARREDIPLAFVRYSHEPLGAHGLVYCLILSADSDVRHKQLAIIEEAGIPGLVELVHTLGPGVQALGAPRRLPLLEMCLPALKAMSLPQYRMFKRTFLGMIRADARTELHEWCLYQLLRHYLDPEFIQVKASRPRFAKLKKVAYHVRVALSVLAHEGSGEAEVAFRLGADALGFDTMAILPRDQCSVAAFSKAVSELADCYPLLKPRLLKAMALAAGADGTLSPVEREIIASMAAVMDCPVALEDSGPIQV